MRTVALRLRVAAAFFAPALLAGDGRDEPLLDAALLELPRFDEELRAPPEALPPLRAAAVRDEEPFEAAPRLPPDDFEPFDDLEDFEDFDALEDADFFEADDDLLLPLLLLPPFDDFFDDLLLLLLLLLADFLEEALLLPPFEDFFEPPPPPFLPPFFEAMVISPVQKISGGEPYFFDERSSRALATRCTSCTNRM